MEILGPARWRQRRAEHEARADALTAAHRARRADGRKHPVEDFLFTYYSWKPGQLRRWHPGAGVGLEVADDLDNGGWRFYVETAGVVALDAPSFLEQRADSVTFIRDLLTRTSARTGRFGCFGLHEWAMVYRLDPTDVRHSGWPLRLGPEGTDAVVESHQIACSHFDAFRFFTPEATSRNLLQPTRASQAASEQPGCLHAGMDLYKWAMKLSPAISSELALDCFELARDIRELDMRAAPYDLRELGYEPVPIETPEGKAAYVEQQRAFSERGQALRVRLIEAIDRISPPRDPAPSPPSQSLSGPPVRRG